MSDVLVATLAVLTATIVALLLLTAGARTVRLVAARRRHSRVQRLRPLVAQLAAADDDLPPTLPPGLTHHDLATLEQVALDVLPKVRGRGRSQLVDLLVARGLADDARRRLRRPGPVGRARAVLVIGALGIDTATNEVVGALSDRHPEVRIAAVRALGQLSSAQAVDALVACLSAPDRYPAGLVGAALAGHGTRSGAALVSCLHDGPPIARTVAAQVLGATHAQSARTALVDRLAHDAEPGVRRAAAGALGRIGSPRSVDALVEASLHDPAPEVRAAALSALGDVGDPRAVPVLRDAVGHPHHEVASSAAAALTRVGEAGPAALESLAATAATRPGRYAQAALAELRRAGAGTR